MGPRAASGFSSGLRLASGRLALEDLVALGDRDPGLLAAGPDMPRRTQPGRVVERAAPQADDAVPRHAADPGTAFRADQPDIRASAVGHPLQAARFDPGQAETRLGHDDTQRERAARQPLTVEAVAGIDVQRLLGDLVAHLPALAPAGLRQLHFRPRPDSEPDRPVISPLLLFQGQVFEGGGVHKALDAPEPGFADPRTDRADKGELPDRGVDRLLV